MTSSYWLEAASSFLILSFSCWWASNISFAASMICFLYSSDTFFWNSWSKVSYFYWAIYWIEPT